MTSFLILSLEPSIDWETERASALAVTIHPCCQFDFVWLNLLLTIWLLNDVISNLTLVSHEPIMRPESGWRNAFIYVTGSGLIVNDAHPAAWVCLCVYFSCGQRRCFTIKRGTRRRWSWYCASQAETGLIPSCCYQGGEKPICGIYQHEQAHKYAWTYAGPHTHIILPVVKEK